MELIKKRFTKRVLEEESRRLDTAQTRAIQKLTHFRTGSLLNDRKYTVSESGSIGGKLTLTHSKHQRFLDIKKKNLKNKPKRKKNYNIHNRIIFGHFNNIAYKLMYGLTSEVAENIKQELDNKTI